MRISDWSSDVCSSDLRGRTGPRRREWQVARLAHELSQPAAQPRSRGDDLSGRSSPRSLLRRVEDRQSFAKARGGRRGPPMPSLHPPPRHPTLPPFLPPAPPPPPHAPSPPPPPPPP